MRITLQLPLLLLNTLIASTAQAQSWWAEDISDRSYSASFTTDTETRHSHHMVYTRCILGTRVVSGYKYTNDIVFGSHGSHSESKLRFRGENWAPYWHTITTATTFQNGSMQDASVSEGDEDETPGCSEIMDGYYSADSTTKDGVTTHTSLSYNTKQSFRIRITDKKAHCLQAHVQAWGVYPVEMHRDDGTTIDAVSDLSPTLVVDEDVINISNKTSSVHQMSKNFDVVAWSTRFTEAPDSACAPKKRPRVKKIQ